MVTSFKHLATQLLGLSSVAVIVALSLAQPGVTQILSPANNNLEDSPELSGLKINRERVKLLANNSRSLPAILKLLPHEERIPSENPNIIALARYDEKHACHLRLFDAAGKILGEIHCNSTEILIPKDKNILWIVGWSRADGFDYPYDGKSTRHHEGLYEYDFAGTKKAEVPPSRTGFIRTQAIRDDGSVVMLNYDAAQAYITYVADGGDVTSRFIVPNAVSEMRLLGNGQFCSIQLYYPSKDRLASVRRALLYDASGNLIAEYSGTQDEFPEIVGMSVDGTHFAVAKSAAVAEKRRLEIYSVKDSTSPISSIHVASYPSQLILENKGQYVLTRKDLGFSRPGKHKIHFEIVDSSGTEHATYDCDDNPGSSDMRFDEATGSATWVCGESRLILRVTSETQ